MEKRDTILFFSLLEFFSQMSSRGNALNALSNNSRGVISRHPTVSQGNQPGGVIFQQTSVSIATWNVRSLLTPESQRLFFQNLISKEVDVCAVQECRIAGEGEVSQFGYSFYYVGQSDSQPGPRNHGVGIAVKGKFASSVASIHRYSKRMMSLYIGDLDLWVVAAYAPTSTASESEAGRFYDELKEALAASCTDRVVILGDFNARLSPLASKMSPRDGPIGPFVDAARPERNGDLLTNFLTLEGLYSMASWFRHKKIHRGTWINPDSRISLASRCSAIDHIVASESVRRCITDCRVVRSADVGSDHFLLAARLEVSTVSRRSARQFREHFGASGSGIYRWTPAAFPHSLHTSGFAISNEA